MNKLKYLSLVAAAAILSFTGCKKSETATVNHQEKTAPPQSIKTQWTDFMTDNFATGWSVDTEAGNWWWQSATGINWAIVHSTSTATKGRAEVSRPLTYFNGTDKT